MAENAVRDVQERVLVDGPLLIRDTALDLVLSRIAGKEQAGVRFDGIPGASLSARANWEGWSALDGLGSSAVHTRDAWEYAAGADVTGPRLASRVVQLRAGVRIRTLPFEANGVQGTENAISGGLGVPLAEGRAALDLAVQRAARSASGSGASERGWTLGVGLTVRP